jgi:hypothetical protein
MLNFSGTKPTLESKDVATTTLPQSTHAKLPKPKHQNAQLEQLIAEKKGETMLHLSFQELTDEDMVIVAYYALQENTVSNVEFYVMTEERNGFFCPDDFLIEWM